MLKVHHLRLSQSSRILFLLEELGLDYELILYDRDPNMSAPADYKALSPTGTAPVIEDGDLVLSESSAIVDYIIDRHAGGRLRPSVEDPMYPRYLFWFHACQGSIQSMLTMQYVLNLLVGATPFPVRLSLLPLRFVFKKINEGFMAKRLTDLLALMERDLANAPWLAGEALTAADVLLSYSIAGLEQNGLNERYPNCQAYVARLRARPAYQRAVDKGGPFVAPPARYVIG